ncbi:unnamed protein product, partial [Nippostrongylus brasiliensis]|uniref:Uncharacterized protein n=1 Tax=Nippostrongylus brasiliensis TaxID=27835 RepID=A0A0N4YQS2_NIPBR
MGPVTRSQSRQGESGSSTPLFPLPVKDEGPSGAGTQCPDPTATLHQLASALQELEDSATVYGRDAHRLRDTAVDAISDVRQEALDTSSRLAQEIREGNTALLSGLNASFEAVDARIQAIPAIASLSPEGSAPRISTFSGTGDGLQFSSWLRRFEDIIRMRVVPLSSEQKANMLVAHLEGVAREKIEDLS